MSQNLTKCCKRVLSASFAALPLLLKLVKTGVMSLSRNLIFLFIPLVIGCGNTKTFEFEKLADSNRIEVYLNDDEFSHIKARNEINDFIDKFLTNKQWRKTEFNSAWEPMPTFLFFSNNTLKGSFWYVEDFLLTKQNETYYYHKYNYNFVDSLSCFVKERTKILSISKIRNGGS